MTQAELARQVGCDRAQINRYLKGKRDASRDMAVKLREVVKGTTLIDWLFAKQNTRKLEAAVRRAK